MLTRSLLTFLAATAVSMPVLVGPALVTPAAAEVGVSVNIGVPAAPMPLFEAVPVARPGYAWTPGAWRWEHDHHVWERGRWNEERHDRRVAERREEHREARHEERREEHREARHDARHDAHREVVADRSHRDHDGHR